MNQLVKDNAYGAHQYMNENIYTHPTVYLPAFQATQPDEVLDMAYIGAGFGSGWMSWKVSERVKDITQATFEKSQRIGGRFMSVLPGVNDPIGPPDTIVDEFGGMRIFPEIMPGMEDVVTSFGGTLVASPLIEASNFFFDFQNDNAKMSRMAMQEPYSGYESRLKACIETHVSSGAQPALDSISTMDFLLNNCGFSVDEVGQYLATIGYDFPFQSISVDEYVKEKDLTTSQTVQYLLKMGWNEMVLLMTHRGGSLVAFGRTLDEIAALDNGNVKLGFSDGSTVLAKNVYITVAPSQFGNIKGLDHLKPMVDENLVWGSGTKIFLNWAEPWWKALGLTTGRSVINHPLVRQVFYWDDNTLLLYTAGFVSDPKAEFQTPDGTTRDCLPSLTECEYASDIIRKGAVTDMKTLIDELVAVLSVTHGIEVPQPEYTRYKYWPNLWAIWGTGSNKEAVYEAVRRPLGNDVNVWFGSSMISETQGWGEGSIQQAQASIDEIVASLS